MKHIDIKKLYESLGLNKTDFASKLGVTHVAIKHIEDRKTISKHMITTICAVFPSVSRGYLETGKGEMFVKNDKPLQDSAGYSPEIQEMVDTVVEVMHSDNDTVKDALKQNLVAFRYAVRLEQDMAGKDKHIESLQAILNPEGPIGEAMEE